MPCARSFHGVKICSAVVCITMPKANNCERTFLEARYIQPALATGRYCSKNTYKFYFLILGPLIGDCVDDQFSISGGTGRGTPIICGTNTGYHSKCPIIYLRS